LTGPKFNYKKYEIKTVNVPAIDGETIPLTILCEKLSNQYPKKLMIKVYGYYGLPNEVSYDNTNYSVL
jgi:protease II